MDRRRGVEVVAEPGEERFSFESRSELGRRRFEIADEVRLWAVVCGGSDNDAFSAAVAKETHAA
jgi:hypothetical protein